MTLRLAEALALLTIDRSDATCLQLMLDRAFLLPQALVESYRVVLGLHKVGLIPVIRRH